MNAQQKGSVLWFVQTHPGIQAFSLKTPTPLHEVAHALAADTIRMRGWPIFKTEDGREIVVNPAHVETVSEESSR